MTTARDFHQFTIRGLIQTTVNYTYSDLTRRQLIEEGLLVDWTELRSLNNEINLLFEGAVNSPREENTLDNIIVEIQTRAASIYLGLANSDEFDQYLKNGIKVYSQYIRINNYAAPPNVIEQTLEAQYKWGILENRTLGIVINHRIRRYHELVRELRKLIQRFIRRTCATNFTSQELRTAYQLCSWCLFKYRQTPLYRTVLRSYIENLYNQVDQVLQDQGYNISLENLTTQVEAFVNEKCTYFHFNLEDNAARLISTYYRRRLQIRAANMTMTQNQLQNVLTAVLGQHGLNINQTYQQLTNAIQNIPQPPVAPPRELSLVKIVDFYGKDSEDPHEWLDQFNRAATANQWQNGRLLDIAKGYLKGAAGDWIRATTAAAAGINQIVRWTPGNAGQNNTSFETRFIEKFAPETKQNRWYQELVNIRQVATESVDDYSFRFQRLLRKADPTGLIPAVMQVRMYLNGLTPLLTPLVSTAAPADLPAAIERARTVETGYNYAPTVTNNNNEIDELTKKIEQLSLNYANVVSALTVQPANQTFNNNREQNRRSNFQRNSQGQRRFGNNNERRKEDRTCYKCNRPGHIARNCRARLERSQRTRFNTRNVNYLDFSDEQQEHYDYQENYSGDDDDNERDLYQYESEIYPITRSGQNYIPHRTNTSSRRPIVDELDEVQRNTAYNSRTSGFEYNSELGKESSRTTPLFEPKRRSRISPAPIESLTEFDVADYLQNQNSGLTVGQAAHLSPKYRAGLNRAIRRSYKKEGEKEANFVESDEDNATTAAKVTLRANGKVQTAIVDSGAATSIITKALLKKLNCEIDKPSNLIVVTANGARIKSLGIVSDLPITIGKINIPTAFQVLESKDEVLILGNEWLRDANAVMDWNHASLTIRDGDKTAKIPIAFTKAAKLNTLEENNSEESEEAIIYYSDISTEEEDLTYNPWRVSSSQDMRSYDQETEDDPSTTRNPAIFLAENEQANDQNAEWNLEKDLHVGPLDHHQQQLFLQLISDSADVCASSQMDIGRTNILKHDIHTGNHAPIAKQAYKSNPVKKVFIENEIQDMEKRGIIRKSKSPWASPVVIVDKKDGTQRFCVDYRGLNKITKIDRYPLPRIDELLETFRTAHWFTTLDLASGYWQVEMNEADKEKTAFVTHKGLYEFNVMPFGLCNAPGTFQRLMNFVLQDFLGKFVAVYLDDIIIYSRTFEQHIDHLKLVFEALRTATLKIKLKKGFFCFPNIAFLGHIVGRNGISPDPAKVEKIMNFPEPTNLKELRGALGLFSYYRKFVKDFSRIAKPLLMLLKKDTPFEWNTKQQNAFDYLKKKLMEAPILQYPDFSKPFLIYTDASGTGLGAVLSQLNDEEKECVIAYASRSLNKAECNYGITDQECLAVVWAVKHFEQYLGLLPFKIITDHSALKFLQTADMPSGRRARWIMYLQQFKFEIIHRPGKDNKNADALSRIPETQCFFIGAENEGGEDNSKNFLTLSSLKPASTLADSDNETDYDGDSEESNDLDETPSEKTLQIPEFPEYITNLNKELREIQQQREEREKRLKIIEESMVRIQEIRAEIVGKEERKPLVQRKDNGSDDESEINLKIEEAVTVRSPRPYSCCGEIWCTCMNNDNFYDDDHEVAQENESYYSEKHAEDIISHYSNEPRENSNGWGSEYYDNDTWNNHEAYNDTINEGWGLPDAENEAEQHIDEVWSFWTVAWTYDKNEVTRLMNDVIETRWTIANQPTKRGKWKCDDYCDTENHHVHVWCKICQRRIDREERMNHNCRFGIGTGQVHPEMNPEHLFNDVFWTEPQLANENIPERSEEYEKHLQHLQAIHNINKRHFNELNGEGTSRIPLIENQEKPHIGKRFKNY